MVFNKEEEIPRTGGRGGEKKVQCNTLLKHIAMLREGENSHSSRRANGHASISTSPQLLSVC